MAKNKTTEQVIKDTKERIELAKNEVRPPGMVNHIRIGSDFTGIARSIECFDNQGFNNFRILTLYVTKGSVTKIDVSDPYANFEAVSRLELWNDIAMINLNMHWKHGKTLMK